MHSATGFVSDHPVRSIRRRLRGILVDVASTPPQEEGNAPTPPSSISYITVYGTRHMKKICLAIFLIFLATVPAHAAEVLVAAASDLGFAVKEIIGTFEA